MHRGQVVSHEVLLMKNVRGAFRIKISKVGFEREKYFVRDFFREMGGAAHTHLRNAFPSVIW